MLRSGSGFHSRLLSTQQRVAHAWCSHRTRTKTPRVRTCTVLSASTPPPASSLFFACITRSKEAPSLRRSTLYASSFDMLHSARGPGEADYVLHT